MLSDHQLQVTWAFYFIKCTLYIPYLTIKALYIPFMMHLSVLDLSTMTNLRAVSHSFITDEYLSLPPTPSPSAVFLLLSFVGLD